MINLVFLLTKLYIYKCIDCLTLFMSAFLYGFKGKLFVVSIDCLKIKHIIMSFLYGF